MLVACHVRNSHEQSLAPLFLPILFGVCAGIIFITKIVITIVTSIIRILVDDCTPSPGPDDGMARMGVCSAK